MNLAKLWPSVRLSSMNSKDFIDHAFEVFYQTDEDRLSVLLQQLGLDPNGDLSQQDFSECNLSSQIFSGTDFSGTVFERANLQSSVFNECNFEGCDFSKSNLSRAVFVRCDMNNCTTEKANCEDVQLISCSTNPFVDPASLDNVIEFPKLVPISSSKKERGNESKPIIRIIGCGGGGGNALNRMIQSGLKRIEYIAANTDAQDLVKSLATTKIQLGTKLTKGLGAGANPEIGRLASIESLDSIREAVRGADMVIVTCGLGGGTGSGAAPVIAQVAKDYGIFTVAVATMPFYFEGKRRLEQADEGFRTLKHIADSTITIANDRLLQLAEKKASFSDMLKKADEMLYHAIKAMTDLVTVQGLINLDFTDVKSAMSQNGVGLIGTGIASGPQRASMAALKAISSPLFNDSSIKGAKAILINISCGPEMLIDEVAEAADIIYREAHDDAEIFFGTVFDPDAGDVMRVTILAAGFDEEVEELDLPLSKAELQRVMLLGVKSLPKVRDHAPSLSRNIPAYLRKSEAPRPQKITLGPGEKEFIFDENSEFDVPSFIRRNAN